MIVLTLASPNLRITGSDKDEVFEALEAVVLYRVANGGGALLTNVECDNYGDACEIQKRVLELRHEVGPPDVTFKEPEFATR
jgi:hypothetical protein